MDNLRIPSNLSFTRPVATPTANPTANQPVNPTAQPVQTPGTTAVAESTPAAEATSANETRQVLSADAPAQSISFPSFGATAPPAADTIQPIQPLQATQEPSAPAAPSPEIEAAKAHLNQRFQTLATENPEGLKALLNQVYGAKASPEQLDQLMQQAREGNLPMPEMRFVPAADLQGHHGAYSAAEGVIYLSENLRTEPGLLNTVVEAEIGHHLDQVLGGDDTPGDEGQMLAVGLAQGGGTLSAEDLAAARELSDHKIMEIDGKQVEVETIAPAVVAGLWWAGQVTAKTGVDAAIDLSIAAILGVPPPGAAAHIGNALANAVPGLGYWRTSRKLQRLGRAINEVRESFAALSRIPGGQQIQARFNRAASDMQHLLRNGNVMGAQRKMTELLNVIQEAHVVKAAGRVATTVSRTDFYRNISRLPVAERVPQILDRARDHARSQGWVPRPDLARRNGGREVFFDERNNRFLSVDTQHGDFEVLNRRGRHQGSIDLWGDKTHNRHNQVYTDRSHDLFVD